MYHSADTLRTPGGAKSAMESCHRNRTRRRMALVLVFAFSATSVPAGAQSQRPQTSTEARALARQAAADARSAEACIKSQAKSAHAAELREQRAQKRKSELEAEKARVLAELRSGRFCNKCWRSATEIEKGGQSFAQHLTDVKGEPKPAPADKIARREADFNQRIASAERDRARAEGQRTSAEQKEKACVAKRNEAYVLKAFAENLAKRLAALELKYKKELERQRMLAKKKKAEEERRKSKEETTLDKVL